MAHAEMNALAQLPMNRGDSATSAVVCDVLAELAAGDDAATTDIVLAKLWKDLVRIGS